MNKNTTKQITNVVSQTRKIQSDAKIKEYSKKIAERIQQKRNFHTTQDKKGGGHHDDHHHGFEQDEDDKKFGFTAPKTPAWEMFLTKFMTMNFVFWVWYNLIHKDGYKRVLSLERPHYEPPMGDSASDDDDEFWDKNINNFMKPNKEELEILVQSYIHREAKSRPELKDAIERLKKW